MAQISVKFDHNLKQSPIVIPLEFPSSKEGDTSGIGNAGSLKQTALYGVKVPLIKVNDVVISPTDITYMELNGNERLPKLVATVQDSSGYIRGLQPPGLDNELRLQILPRFDNAYRKIDMTFYIENYSERDGELTMRCRYKVPDLYSSRIECFGEVCSYDLCEYIAQKCSLGYATNVEKGNDIQYAYCANESYISILDKIIESSGSDDIQSRIVYDWWVDFWNSINLIDIYERYNTVDPNEDMMIYVSGGFGQDISQVSDDENNYINTVATITNHPNEVDNDLYVDEYRAVNKSKMVENGSDRVITIYGESNMISDDYLLQDGDQKRDVFTKYEYTGEYYGDYNYLLAKECRKMMMDKMETEVIEVTVNSPLISLMRGSKVNLEWYDISSKLQGSKEALGINDDEIESNIELPKNDIKGEDIQITINKQISGQYYILGSKILYGENNWANTLRLVRPRSGKQNLVDLYEETKNLEV